MEDEITFRDGLFSGAGRYQTWILWKNVTGQHKMGFIFLKFRGEYFEHMYETTD